MVAFRYTENGVRYVERAYTIIENMGPLAGGLWANRNTVYLRAPEAEFAAWEPLLHHIRRSGEANFAWVAQEAVNQEFLAQAFRNAQQAEQWRAQRALEVQRQLQQIDQEIVEHTRRTHAEIRNDQYLNMTNQEEYVNPYTGKVDTGSNQWKHRWVTDSGDEFYTDDDGSDPNQGSLLNRTWQRSAIRPRFPQ